MLSNIKSAITRRTNFDTAIVNNAFKSLTAKQFYDIINIINMRLKNDGILFFSIPEKRGFSRLVNLSGKQYENGETIDNFTAEYILKNLGFDIIEKGNHEKFDEDSNLAKAYSEIGEIYGKNELFELSEIKFKPDNFRSLKLLSKFDILSSEELNTDKSIKGKMKKYFYGLTSLYFENVRKSFNEIMKSINNNIHLQINSEMNEINRKNRERLLIIYFNIFKQLMFEVKNLGYDIKELKQILSSISSSLDIKLNIDDKVDLIISDFENIDKLLGLQFSSRYFLARKL